MNIEEREFIKKRFAEYYAKAEFPVNHIEQREFGVGFEKKIEKRHIAFADDIALRSYLMNQTPFFISHSEAFYKEPGATPIERKGWNGAELVFDLDAHGETKYDFGPLKALKSQVITLVEDYLLNDFGIDKDKIITVFSGNRGYHIYVKDEAFYGLGSNERREIVDYVCGTGLDYKQFFSTHAITKRLVRVEGPKPSEQGWRGRFARAVLNMLEKEPTKLSRKFKDETERARFASGINEGNWSKTSAPNIFEHVGKVMEGLEVKKVLADGAVTYDVSKLIRMPNSIHGDSAMRAMPVSDIDRFNPHNDALISCPELKLAFLEDVPALEFADSTHGPFTKGTNMQVAGPLGMFLVLKGSAQMIF